MSVLVFGPKTRTVFEIKVLKRIGLRERTFGPRKGEFNSKVHDKT
jgi:hypothetical protein